MKSFLAVVVLVSSFSALAAEYPALEAYKASAVKVVSAVKGARSGAEISQLETDSRALAVLGAAVMKLYGEKNPICAPQFATMTEELPRIESMTLAEVRARYHNGTGLPAAPKHCYFGRSLIVHPVMSAMKIKSGWKESMRASILHEAEEVVEHIVKIQKNLDAPPAN